MHLQISFFLFLSKAPFKSIKHFLSSFSPVCLSINIGSWVILPFLNPCCVSSIVASNFSLNLFSIALVKTLLGIFVNLIIIVCISFSNSRRSILVIYPICFIISVVISSYPGVFPSFNLSMACVISSIIIGSIFVLVFI
jgi:hypothetical protein